MLPFAPPNPNELAAARDPGNGVTSVHTFKRPSTNAGISFRGCLKFKFGGTEPDSNANRIFVIEHMPELASVCPIFDFTEPTNNGSLRFVQNTRSRVRHSSGSPTLVPRINTGNVINQHLKYSIKYTIQRI